MSKTVKLVFTVSILLNIILIGAGAGLYHKYAQHSYGPGKDVRAELSAESRKIMRENFMKARKEFKPVFDDMRDARRDMEQVLQADTFDEEAYDSAVEKLLDIRDDMSRKKAENAKNFLEKLPAEERKAMAEHMSKRLSGHGGGRKHNKHKEGKPE